MDRLVHWWLLGDAMQDTGLKSEAMGLLNKYAQEGCELPVVSELSLLYKILCSRLSAKLRIRLGAFRRWLGTPSMDL